MWWSTGYGGRERHVILDSPVELLHVCLVLRRLPLPPQPFLDEESDRNVVRGVATRQYR